MNPPISAAYEKNAHPASLASYSNKLSNDPTNRDFNYYNFYMGIERDPFYSLYINEILEFNSFSLFHTKITTWLFPIHIPKIQLDLMTQSKKALQNYIKIIQKYLHLFGYSDSEIPANSIVVNYNNVSFINSPQKSNPKKFKKIMQANIKINISQNLDAFSSILIYTNYLGMQFESTEINAFYSKLIDNYKIHYTDFLQSKNNNVYNTAYSKIQNVNYNIDRIKIIVTQINNLSLQTFDPLQKYNLYKSCIGLIVCFSMIFTSIHLVKSVALTYYASEFSFIDYCTYIVFHSIYPTSNLFENISNQASNIYNSIKYEKTRPTYTIQFNKSINLNIFSGSKQLLYYALNSAAENPNFDTRTLFAKTLQDDIVFKGVADVHAHATHQNDLVKSEKINLIKSEINQQHLPPKRTNMQMPQRDRADSPVKKNASEFEKVRDIYTQNAKHVGTEWFNSLDEKSKLELSKNKDEIEKAFLRIDFSAGANLLPPEQNQNLKNYIFFFFSAHILGLRRQFLARKLLEPKLQNIKKKYHVKITDTALPSEITNININKNVNALFSPTEFPDLQRNHALKKMIKRLYTDEYARYSLNRKIIIGNEIKSHENNAKKYAHNLKLSHQPFNFEKFNITPSHDLSSAELKYLRKKLETISKIHFDTI